MHAHAHCVPGSTPAPPVSALLCIPACTALSSRAQEKIKLNNQLPYLVGNVVEVLDVKPDDDEEEDGAAVDLDAQRKGKCVVLKTTTRQTIFLPVVGLVDADKLRPGDLVGVNKDSYLILDTLPAEYDSRVKAMEVDEKPTEDYTDVGGLDKQIQELVEAVVLPIQHKDRFKALGIRPPKGVLLYGPPGAHRPSTRCFPGHVSPGAAAAASVAGGIAIGNGTVH